jgi:ATP-dependent RNA helicase DDX10/DBP4
MQILSSPEEYLAGGRIQSLIQDHRAYAVQELAQRAVQSYLRSVHLQPNRAVFDVARLPAADFALSLGLASTPKLRFLKRSQAGAAVAARDTPGRGSRAADSGTSEEGGNGRGAASESDIEQQAHERRAAGAAAGTSSGSGRGGQWVEGLLAGAPLQSDGRVASREGRRPTGAEGHEGGEHEGSDDDDFMVVKRRNVLDGDLPLEQGNTAQLLHSAGVLGM